MGYLNFIVCQACGIEFGVPEIYDDKRRQDGKSFYCPSGHSLSYGEGEITKLRRERDRLQQRIAEKDDKIMTAERSARAYKGRVTRIKNRVGKGVCPCCNRSFENLARHMTSKHPDYADAAEQAA